MQLSKPLRDRQPKSGSAARLASRSGFVGTVKPIKNVGLICRCDATSGIGYGKTIRVVAGDQGHPDLSTRVCEFHSVVKEDKKELPDQSFIAFVQRFGRDVSDANLCPSRGR